MFFVMKETRASMTCSFRRNNEMWTQTHSKFNGHQRTHTPPVQSPCVQYTASLDVFLHTPVSTAVCNRWVKQSVMHISLVCEYTEQFNIEDFHCANLYNE